MRMSGQYESRSRWLGYARTAANAMLVLVVMATGLGNAGCQKPQPASDAVEAKATATATTTTTTTTTTEQPPPAGDTSQACISCHREKKVGVAAIAEWERSRHAKEGIGCFDCHQADKSDKDAMEHYGQTIAIIVSPKDCSPCHEEPFKQFQASHHAKAGEILGSLDNVLGEIVEGPPAAVLGCQQCHGSEVIVLEGGKLDPTTWPNTGIGRINPDGSLGSCSACHSRHLFDAKVARRPENCGKCHMGPDHPQMEIYEESKHGIAFHANEDLMALDSDTWVVGEDYTAAPTCATCHMAAAPGLAATHDPGERISWTLRPAVSKRQENWEERRGKLTQVCINCHSESYAKSFFKQFDEAVNLYNDKFGQPAVDIMAKLKEAGKVTPDPFDDKIEWTFFFLWHHEGRRARHGAAMMGPDYTQWHGFFEVANRFYNELIPEAEELLEGVSDEILSRDEHKWKKGLSAEDKARIKAFYKNRYGQ